MNVQYKIKEQFGLLSKKLCFRLKGKYQQQPKYQLQNGTAFYFSALDTVLIHKTHYVTELHNTTTFKAFLDNNRYKKNQ